LHKEEREREREREREKRGEIPYIFPNKYNEAHEGLAV